MFFWKKLQPASGELLHLDMLRFVASAGIVLHHSLEFFFPPARRGDITDRTMGLALFVDLFFMISGLVIAYVYHDRLATRAGYGRFLQRRVGRLVPLHWLTLLIAMAVWGSFAAIHAGAAHAPDFAPVCIVNTALLLHAVIPCGNNLQFNGVSWSISVEMIMYLAFPLIAMTGARWPKTLPWFALALIVALVLRFDDGGVMALRWTDLPAVPRAVPSFLLGAGLYYNRHLVRRLPHAVSVLCVSLISLIAGMLAGLPQLLLLALIYVVVAAAIAADMGTAATSPVKRAAALGQLTYSIYMWHGLVILVVMNALGDKFLHAGPVLMGLLAALSYAGILVMAGFSFFHIETPARRWVDGLGQR